MATYIAYYRVSTQRQNISLSAQRTAVHNYLENIDGATIIGEYQEKESGKNNNREQLDLAIKECKRTNSTLIIAKLDRLSRNVAFVFALKDANIQFVACDLPEFNTLTLAIFCGMAQHERELCSQRTRTALQELKIKKNVKLGRPNASFSDEDRKKASISNRDKVMNHPNTKKAVAMIKLLLAQTTNLSEISRKLNEDGFRTCTESLFRPATVKRIILRHSLTKVI